MPRVKFMMKRFRLAKYESNPSDFNPIQEAKFEELTFTNNHREPEPDSPKSASNGMVINLEAKTVKSSLPVIDQVTTLHSPYTKDTNAKNSSFVPQRPYQAGVARESKRPRQYELEDKLHAISSSGSSGFKRESSCSIKNSLAHFVLELNVLEENNNFLMRKTGMLEIVRDKLRGLIIDRVCR